MWKLKIGRKNTGLTVRPDATWPGMWRIHHGDIVSDMVNLARAKEAAISWVRPRGLGGGEVAKWEHQKIHRRETGAEAALVAQTVPA